MPHPLPPDTELLLPQMDRLVALMEHDGQSYWNVRVRQAADFLRQGDREGFGHFLSGFGTSGSFNECHVGKGEWVDSKFVWEPGQQAIHEEFEHLKSDAIARARQLQRESEPRLRSLAASAPALSARTRTLLTILAIVLVAFVGHTWIR